MTEISSLYGFEGSPAILYARASTASDPPPRDQGGYLQEFADQAHLNVLAVFLDRGATPYALEGLLAFLRVTGLRGVVLIGAAGMPCPATEKAVYEQISATGWVPAVIAGPSDNESLPRRKT